MVIVMHVYTSLEDLELTGYRQQNNANERNATAIGRLGHLVWVGKTAKWIQIFEHFYPFWPKSRVFSKPRRALKCPFFGGHFGVFFLRGTCGNKGFSAKIEKFM